MLRSQQLTPTGGGHLDPRRAKRSRRLAEQGISRVARAVPQTPKRPVQDLDSSAAELGRKTKRPMAREVDDLESQQG